MKTHSPQKTHLYILSLLITVIAFGFTSCGSTHAYMGVESDYGYYGEHPGYYNMPHHKHHKPPKHKFKKYKHSEKHHGKAPKHDKHHHDHWD